MGQLANGSAGSWQWSPELGRWSLVHGLPDTPVYFEIATDAVPAASRYDYWRNLAHYSFDSRPIPAESAAAFTASAQCLVGSRAQLFRYNSDAVSGQGIPAEIADDRETYLVGVVLKGQRDYVEERGGAVSSKAGQFFVFDNRGRSHVDFSAHDAVHISLPRIELERMLGGAIPSPDEMCRALEMSRMGPALKSQLGLIAGHMAAANAVERAFLLSQATQMAFFTCETATAELQSRKRATPEDLRSLAISVIEQELTSPDLSVSRLLEQLGCSRATLYRAFAGIEGGVSGVISALRIDRAKAIIARSPEMPVSVVAARCGWYDSASFARAFKRHAGLSPSEYREDLRSA